MFSGEVLAMGMGIFFPQIAPSVSQCVYESRSNQEVERAFIIIIIICAEIRNQTSWLLYVHIHTSSLSWEFCTDSQSICEEANLCMGNSVTWAVTFPSTPCEKLPLHTLHSLMLSLSFIVSVKEWPVGTRSPSVCFTLVLSHKESHAYAVKEKDSWENSLFTQVSWIFRDTCNVIPLGEAA